MKHKRMPYTSYANETFLVRHRGRAIRIYRMPIPGFHGEISEEVKQLAAEKAYKHGWRKIVLTWGDKLASCNFDDGYCWVLGLNVAMAQNRDSNYMVEHYLCDMDACGEMYKPEPVNKADVDDNHRWACAYENDGWAMDLSD